MFQNLARLSCGESGRGASHLVCSCGHSLTGELGSVLTDCSTVFLFVAHLSLISSSSLLRTLIDREIFHLVSRYSRLICGRAARLSLKWESRGGRLECDGSH